MWFINGTVTSRRISWYCDEAIWDKEEGLNISFNFSSSSFPIQRRAAIKNIKKILEKDDIPWIILRYNEWTLDLDKLKKSFPKLSSLNWLKGKVSIEPEFETEEEIVSGERVYKERLVFYITPEDLEKYDMILEIPNVIKESLKHFKNDYPNPNKVAFIMMRFGKTNAYNKIVEAIKKVLDSHGIMGVRADDKEYHDYIFPNIMTYMQGCGFGIAVFEHIEIEEFNPNVSLEVGYMLALKKPVCLLKDRTLETLQSDLGGNLYKEFDLQDPIKSIPSEINKWLEDRGII